MLLLGRLAVAKDSTLGIADALLPRYKTHLRSFFGACNVVRRFIESFSYLVEPINRWLCKDAKSEWDDPQSLTSILVERLVLALPLQTQPFMLDMDSSAYQLGVTILQKQDDSSAKSRISIA